MLPSVSSCIIMYHQDQFSSETHQDRFSPSHRVADPAAEEIPQKDSHIDRRSERFGKSLINGLQYFGFTGLSKGYRQRWLPTTLSAKLFKSICPGQEPSSPGAHKLGIKRTSFTFQVLTEGQQETFLKRTETPLRGQNGVD